MVASEANGFRHILWGPVNFTCQGAPYAFHPMYSSAAPPTDSGQPTAWTTWSAHTDNLSFSNEIGHFESKDGDGDDATLVPPCECRRRRTGRLGSAGADRLRIRPALPQLRQHTRQSLSIGLTPRLRSAPGPSAVLGAPVRCPGAAVKGVNDRPRGMLIGSGALAAGQVRERAMVGCFDRDARFGRISRRLFTRLGCAHLALHRAAPLPIFLVTSLTVLTAGFGAPQGSRGRRRHGSRR